MIGEYKYPHNIIIEFVLMYGIIGIISFILIFSNSLKITISNIRASKQNIYINIYIKALALAWIFYAISAMTSGSFISGNSEFFIFSAILISINLNNILKKRWVR